MIETRDTTNNGKKNNNLCLPFRVLANFRSSNKQRPRKVLAHTFSIIERFEDVEEIVCYAVVANSLPFTTSLACVKKSCLAIHIHDADEVSSLGLVVERRIANGRKCLTTRHSQFVP